jgi:hypothetical protein
MTTPPPEEAPDNFTRLSNHLQDGSLSARLLAAYVAAPAEGREAALQALKGQRLKEIAQTYAATDHQED